MYMYVCTHTYMKLMLVFKLKNYLGVEFIRNLHLKCLITSHNHLLPLFLASLPT